jgi:adenylate cyclase
VERRLTAILCADVHGYSRLMGDDEEATLHTLTSHRKLIDSSIEQHHGRFVNSAGDSVLAEFASVVEAVSCAVEIQTLLKAENASLPPERRMEFRIGVNLGDVMVEGEQIYGDGVNVAARLESLAEPGGICISGTVHDQVRDKLALGYADLGEQAVKNIARPVRVWRVLLDGTAPTRPASRRLPLRFRRAGLFSVVGLAIVIATIVIVQHVSLKPQQTHASIPPQEMPALPLPDIPSIAVLPFTNLSGDPRQEYFSNGISDQLINSLSRLPGLFVTARRSSFAYKGKDTKESEIGKELGVKYLLEGSVSKTADQVRIGVELDDATTGAQVWAEQFNRPLKDIFAVQDEIVGKVVTTLDLLLKLDERKLPHGLGTARPTDDIEAYDDLLRAFESLWRFTKDDNAKGRQWAEKAITRDPKYAAAYATEGALYWTDELFDWSENPATDLKRAAELAQHALALDDSDGTALALQCEIDWMQRRYDEAVAEGRRTVALNPNFAIGYQALTDALMTSGRPQEGISTIGKAIRLDPAGEAFYAFFIGAGYVQMGRYKEAIPFLKKNAAAYPHEPWVHQNLLIAYEELGRDQEAHAEAAEIMRISPLFSLTPPEMGALKDVAMNRRNNEDMRKAGLK